MLCSSRKAGQSWWPVPSPQPLRTEESVLQRRYSHGWVRTPRLARPWSAGEFSVAMRRARLALLTVCNACNKIWWHGCNVTTFVFQQCTNPEYPLEEAVCCKRPPPYPLVTCPFAYQTCLYPHACDKTSGTYEAGGAVSSRDMHVFHGTLHLNDSLSLDIVSSSRQHG